MGEHLEMELVTMSVPEGMGSDLGGRPGMLSPLSDSSRGAAFKQEDSLGKSPNLFSIFFLYMPENSPMKQTCCIKKTKGTVNYGVI